MNPIESLRANQPRHVSGRSLSKYGGCIARNFNVVTATHPALFEVSRANSASENFVQDLTDGQTGSHAREDAEHHANNEASELREIEGRNLWAQTYSAMGLDDVIEIPGSRDGKDITIRCVVEKGGPDS